MLSSASCASACNDWLTTPTLFVGSPWHDMWLVCLPVRGWDIGAGSKALVGMSSALVATTPFLRKFTDLSHYLSATTTTQSKVNWSGHWRIVGYALVSCNATIIGLIGRICYSIVD